MHRSNKHKKYTEFELRWFTMVISVESIHNLSCSAYAVLSVESIQWLLGFHEGMAEMCPTVS